MEAKAPSILPGNAAETPTPTICNSKSRDSESLLVSTQKTPMATGKCGLKRQSVCFTKQGGSRLQQPGEVLALPSRGWSSGVGAASRGWLGVAPRRFGRGSSSAGRRRGVGCGDSGRAGPPGARGRPAAGYQPPRPRGRRKEQFDFGRREGMRGGNPPPALRRLPSCARRGSAAREHPGTRCAPSPAAVLRTSGKGLCSSQKAPLPTQKRLQ